MRLYVLFLILFAIPNFALPAPLKPNDRPPVADVPAAPEKSVAFTKRELGPFNWKPMLLASVIGGIGAFVFKKFVWEAWWLNKYYDDLDAEQKRKGLTPENGGRDIPAERKLAFIAMARNFNQLPTSSQALTADFGKIYPNWVDPYATPSSSSSSVPPSSTSTTAATGTAKANTATASTSHNPAGRPNAVPVVHLGSTQMAKSG